jgi:prepilin-type N-terminal cleavage/methylation domain-containing protein
MKLNTNRFGTASWGFTLVEVMVASLLLGILVLSLLGAFSSGLSVVQAARENMRASQIMVQKMETVRLFTWNQTTNTAIAPTNFVALYDPTVTNSGTIYRGEYRVSRAPESIPIAYRDKMRQVTVMLYWTNYNGNRIRVQSRDVQTFVARYGMQNYVY